MIETDRRSSLVGSFADMCESKSRFSVACRTCVEVQPVGGSRQIPSTVEGFEDEEPQ
ncbi:hypothetical protein RER_07510 [Rhodococcus erythropolis PR4]|uniref:Uncharacterized protein n=1 Tax=Rhodococcus erythropolis (strain PR4 / NBRC 100887) TaxID=234621 RepID=C0ZPY1_RHOE4|nr:hypothetical protein RER_07510 [Rhodococcus erythropolis PR4]